jgi:hypothetical protein
MAGKVVKTPTGDWCSGLREKIAVSACNKNAALITPKGRGSNYTRGSLLLFDAIRKQYIDQGNP